jgi:hypothetical protein
LFVRVKHKQAFFFYLKQSTKADVNLNFFKIEYGQFSQKKNFRKNEARSWRLHRLAITLIGPITLTFSAGREGLSSFTRRFKETVSSDLKQKSFVIRKSEAGSCVAWR